MVNLHTYACQTINVLVIQHLYSIFPHLGDLPIQYSNAEKCGHRVNSALECPCSKGVITSC